MRARLAHGRAMGPLLLVAAVGLVLRLVYALGFAPDIEGLGDDAFYRLAALQLADGLGYVGSLSIFTSGEQTPTADHPPLYPLGLALIALPGGRSLDAQRLLGIGAGTITILLVGLIATRLGGRRAGIAAAVLCAAYPSFVAADGALMSESLFGALVAGCLGLALAGLDRPSPGLVAALGVLVGCAALTRSEGLLLLPLLAVPLLLAAPGRRARVLAVLAAGFVLVVAPWVVRNWDAFGQPVFSTNEGTTLAGANCDRTYYGDELGGFTATCLPPVPEGEDAAATSDHRREAAVEYVREHPTRAVLVTGVRLARLWGFHEAFGQYLEGRDPGLQRLGYWFFYPLLLLGVAGAVVLARRRPAALAVVLAPVVMASLTAVATYGLLRLRHAADVSLLVLAGIAVAEAMRIRARRAEGAG